VLCLVLGFLLALPSLAAPFALDDLFHLRGARGRDPPPLRWWELFTFAPADPARHHLFVAGGLLPWWAARDLRLAFWRPLSSALVALDQAIWGRAVVGWHLHSLLWWMALLACVAWPPARPYATRGGGSRSPRPVRGMRAAPATGARAGRERRAGRGSR
jgi:hypothetical protein